MLVDEADSANTKKQISYVVKRMKIFASSTGVPIIEKMNETELNSFLAKFYAGLRKEDGFVIQKNEEGLRYIVHRDMLRKTRREKDDEGYSSHMYEIHG